MLRLGESSTEPLETTLSPDLVLCVGGCWVSRGEDVTVCLICKSNRQRKDMRYTYTTLRERWAVAPRRFIPLPSLEGHGQTGGAFGQWPHFLLNTPWHLDVLARCHYRKVMQMDTHQACSLELLPVGKSGCSSRLALSEAPVLATQVGA